MEKTFLVIGAGSRAETYMKYPLCKVVGVAEPVDARREMWKQSHNLPDERCFKTWEDALNPQVGKIADMCLVSTLDHLHFEPTLAAARLGYDIILEKPMACFPDQCEMICMTVEQCKVNLYVCHVMRYHPLYRKLKELLDSGVVGIIHSVRWLQPINLIHYVKSYVRHPTWSRVEASGPLTLTKACHDLDLILWLLSSQDYDVLSSWASRSVFVPENQPAEAQKSEWCTKCPINTTCRWSALENYGTYKRYRHFVTDRVGEDGVPTREMAIEDMASGPYDRCAYRTKANVMEQYLAALAIPFTGKHKALVSFEMTAFHDDVCWRTATFIGENGRIELNEHDTTLFVQKGTNSNGSSGESHFAFTAKDCVLPSDTMKGHSGADWWFMDTLMKGENLTTAEESLQSHNLAFDIDLECRYYDRRD